MYIYDSLLLHEAELQVLLKKTKRETDFAEYRNWVITKFLPATGVCSSTLVNIKNEDIDIGSQLVKLSSKTISYEELLNRALQGVSSSKILAKALFYLVLLHLV